MPRISQRAKAIAHQQSIVDACAKIVKLNEVHNDEDSDDEFMLGYHQKVLDRMKKRRYLYRAKTY